MVAYLVDCIYDVEGKDKKSNWKLSQPSILYYHYQFIKLEDDQIIIILMQYMMPFTNSQALQARPVQR